MPRITVDFSQVEEFEALPKGEYDGVIVKAEYREPADSDKFPYINLEMDVTEQEYKGRKLWAILSLSPKALWRTKQTFENLEIYGGDEEMEMDVEEGENGVLMVTNPELVGVPVHLVVSQREYEGRMQNQVDGIFGQNGGTKQRSTTKSGGGPAGSGSKKTGAAKKTGAGRKFR